MNALANFFTRLVNRYMPDPLVIAILLTVLTMLLAVLVQGTSPLNAVRYWGDGCWDHYIHGDQCLYRRSCQEDERFIGWTSRSLSH